MIFITYTWQAFLACYTLWLFFLAGMSLIRARDAKTLTKPAYLLGMPLIAVGIALDIFVNVFICSVITLDLPRQWTTSEHLSLLNTTGKPWQRAVAGWICRNLLNTFDPSGHHCKGD